MRPWFHHALLLLSLTLLLSSLLYLYSIWPKEGLPTTGRKTGLSTAETTPPGPTVYTGRILPEPDPSGTASHRLVDENGNTLAFLQSGKIDLRILESSSKVSVEGRLGKVLEGNLPLIFVDKLSFR